MHIAGVGTHSLACLQEPLFKSVSIMLKYGPWRRKLREVYQVEAQKERWQARFTDKKRQARFMLHLLQQTARQMSGQAHTAWALNVGNNIGFCSGPVPYLTTLGIIKAANQGEKDVLVFGKQGKPKRLCKGTSEIAKTLQKLVTLASTADELIKLPAPRTCKDWVRLFREVVSISRKGRCGSQAVRLSGN